MAEENGITGESYEQLVHNPRVKELLLKELQYTGRKAGLAPFEIIECIVITSSEWTPQNVSSSRFKGREDYANDELGILDCGPEIE